ncbi:FMN-dependent NADH-azoreductase [Paenibacillus sp. A3]|uniref:FMN-dependent NADH-azoreductase n=1 Tax=Paenibacillus sp. A3 TaxID=1337054 RepID=UPI0006D57510|nr:FMN-dependent NADH-azoreductase [Paenibacillus sp. A3]KPV55430.1 FMN-dependent NADH-azoreductase [Paenibacillus sp. A3]
MSATLFIKANNRPIDQAVSVQLYHAFLDSYKEAHPEESITELDLYREKLPYLDTHLISGSYKSGRGLPLTPEEEAITSLADKYLDQFLAADKVVFAFPLWNLTVPAVLHTYFDYLNRAGKTFKFTAEGAIGLVPDKKAVLLSARGGIYSEGEAASYEMSVNWVLANLRLFGMTDISTVIVEGHSQYPDRKEAIIGDGIQRAIQAAKVF